MKTSRFVWPAAPAFLTALLCACSGAGIAPGGSGFVPGMPVPQTAAERAGGRHKTPLVVTIPSPARRAHFISPSTKSLRLVITPVRGGPPAAKLTANLTPSSPGCAAVKNGTRCLIDVTLFQGNYVATVDTYDGLEARGKLLSYAQQVAVSVTPVTTGIALTLSGVPHALNVAPGSYAVLGSQASGFSLYGASAQPLIVTATDADGNAIIGSGSPVFAAQVLSGSGWHVAKSPAPNLVAISPPGTNGEAATVKIDGAYADKTVCARPDAVCSATVSVQNHVQRLFVGNADNSVHQQGNVTIYDAPYTGAPITTITSGTSEPQAILLDPDLNLWVGQCDASCGHAAPDRVEEYAPPYTGAPATTVTNNVTEMLYLAMDPTSRDLFVSYIGAARVGVYSPPYTGAPTNITGQQSPWGMAVDSGNLFVANSGHGAVDVFAPPYTSAPTAITNGVGNPTAVVMDASKNAFVANAANGDVTEYAPPYTGAPVHTMPAFGVTLLAMDGAGDLFVGCPFQNTVWVYPPPYTTVNPVGITTGIGFPLWLASDAVGNLFVANSNQNTVTVYAPPYTGTPVTISNGVHVPQSLALTP